MALVPDSPHDLATECDRLIALAEAMPAVVERRRALAGSWYGQVLDLTQTPSLETPDGERALDNLVSQLRRAWMATAHEFADVTYRSPAADAPKLLPSNTTIAYSYERSLEHNPLAARLPAYRPVPAGWSARHLLFSSGMAALSGIMQTLPAMIGARGTDPSLLVAASYYETVDLAALGTHGCTVRVVNDDDAFAAACAAQPPDAAFVEPIIYDPWLRPFDVARAARTLAALDAPPVLMIDSTLVGPTIPMEQLLCDLGRIPFVVQASSGLKLDQAGLELANVGIVSLYAPAARAHELDAVADRLTMVRRLNGTSLTIDTVALLDVPFFLDREIFSEYCAAVFRHNAQLARAVPAGGLFKTVAHPSLDPRSLPWAQTPFVFFHLRDDDPEAYLELERLIIGAAEARGLAIERGGSFGFRGHRCEAVLLEGAARSGVFKVALGARSGPSVAGIIALLAEIAAFPSVDAARDGLGTSQAA